jgi:hypothetical protein
MKINFRYLILLMAIGLTGGQSCFACVSGDTQPISPFLMVIVLMIFAVVLLCPAYFYSMYVKRGGTKKWLIKLWRVSVILIVLAFIIKGVLSLSMGCVG